MDNANTLLEKMQKVAELKYVRAGGELPVTVVMSRAMEYASKKGYKVMVALLDCNKGTMTKEDRLHTFCDIKSEKLREVIYKEFEDEQ